MSKNEFPEGISIKEPRKEAPDFVKGGVGINLKKFVEWAKPKISEAGWVNLSLNISAKGNYYFSFYNKNGEEVGNVKAKEELPEIDLSDDSDNIRIEDVPF